MHVTQETNGKSARMPASAVSVSLIDESPTNPRKTFAGIEELADDIKLHGLLQDVLLRPHPKKPGRYELVFGARRFRASKLAGLKEIPAKVRDLDDVTTLEIQIVENSKREDIHPLEEADGYEQLHTKHGYSVEEIAAKVGKSTATVYARLKLNALVPEAKKAVFDNKLTIGAALVFARIPHPDVQAKAVKDVVGEHRLGEEPLGQGDVAWRVKQRYMLRLVDAPFDRADASLVAGAPACAACPKRTGNQRELFGDLEVGDRDDLCTDTRCFDAKKAAAWTKRVAEAQAKGQAVLEAKEAKKVFSHGGYVPPGSGYVDLAVKNYDDRKERTNKALLGKAKVPVVVARDENGRIHELVAKADFAKATGGKAKPEARPADAAAKRARARAAKERAAFEEGLAVIVATAERREPTEAFWRALARGFIRAAWADSRKQICARRGIEVPKASSASYSDGPQQALLATAAKMTAAQARGLCVELAATSSRGDASESFKEILALFPTKKKKARAK